VILGNSLVFGFIVLEPLVSRMVYRSGAWAAICRGLGNYYPMSEPRATPQPPPRTRTLVALDGGTLDQIAPATPSMVPFIAINTAPPAM